MKEGIKVGMGKRGQAGIERMGMVDAPVLLQITAFVV